MPMGPNVPSTPNLRLPSLGPFALPHLHFISAVAETEEEGQGPFGIEEKLLSQGRDVRHFTLHPVQTSARQTFVFSLFPH